MYIVRTLSLETVKLRNSALYTVLYVRNSTSSLYNFKDAMTIEFHDGDNDFANVVITNASWRLRISFSDY